MQRVLTVIAAAAACATAWQFASTAQTQPASPELDALKRLTFRSIGPTNQAGRVSVIEGVPGDPFTFYVSGANGGVWKTANAGTTWKPVFDNQNVLSIGEIALAPSNPDII
jgi:photosystem II stability/assembly factor-like uncharacterized protein